MNSASVQYKKKNRLIRMLACAVLFLLSNPAHGAGDVKTEEIAPGPATREVSVSLDKRYLLLPVKNGGAKSHAALLVDGVAVREFDIELSDKPDWFAHLDVSNWKGKQAVLRVANIAGDSRAPDLVATSDEIWHADSLYSEPLRGQLHFSTARGRSNDPNGLVFYRGEYHLFYQHNPYGWSGGNQHWGHAVSDDLVHWKELGDTLYPDDAGMMYSGSGVVDWKNTSGLGKDGNPPLVLLYTACGQMLKKPWVQGLAYSLDGRDFTKFPGNPVVKPVASGNRDPKVIWHEPSGKWVMCLYGHYPSKDLDDQGKPKQNDVIYFLSSSNLKDWTLMSQTEGLFECPDFFELPVDGSDQKKKWVLTVGNGDYLIGGFDGQRFTPETPVLTGQPVRGLYASQTFSDEPQGRVVQIGWLRTDAPGMPFNQSMGLPRELRLTSTTDGLRLTYTPVQELESLRAKSYDAGSVTLQPDSANPLAEVKAELVELRAEFEPGVTGETTFLVRGAKILYDAKSQELSVNNTRIPAPLHDGKLNLTIYCDRTALEIFVSDGLTYIPMPFQAKADNRTVEVRVTGGATKFTALQAYELKSIWNQK
jgi:sucrose-6-phosphate hydrolase SacC (GH32 family)